MNSFGLKILAANGVYFDGESTSLNILTFDGYYGIQANHRNSILAILPGKMNFLDMSGQRINLVASNGVVKIENNQVIILVETCCKEEEFLEKIAKEQEDIKKEEENQKLAMKEYAVAQMRIAKIMNNLSRRSDDI